jgi:hypothetical protein
VITEREMMGRSAMSNRESAHVRWHKSQRSGSDGCVECAVFSETVGVRDSTDRGPTLAFDHATWRAFVDDLKRGSFDRPSRESGYLRR